jgi:TrmH family RNA methyltransferase
MERITSRQNAIVKRFRELARTSRGGPRGTHATAPGHAAEVLLDGEHLLQEALACDIPIEVAAFSDKQLADSRSRLSGLARDIKKRGGRVMTVGDPVLAAISPVQHPSGVVAIGRARPSDIGVVLSGLSDLPVALVLAGLQDPGNVGAIVRAAAAFGASGIVATEGSANPFGWKALRGAMGGTFRVPVAGYGTMADVIAAARKKRVRLVAAVPRGGTALPNLKFGPATAVVLGAEGAGLASEVMTAMDETVTIPMQTPVESLNVAVAAALILYEAMRQRQH